MSISGSRSIDESFLCFLLKHRALHHAPAICAVHQIWAYELLPYKFAVVERFLFESYDILVSGVSSPNQESDIKKLWRQNILYSHIYIYVDVGVTFAVKFLNLYKVSSILKFLYQEKNINFAFAIRQTAQDAWNKYQSLRCVNRIQFESVWRKICDNVAKSSCMNISFRVFKFDQVRDSMHPAECCSASRNPGISRLGRIFMRPHCSV